MRLASANRQFDTNMPMKTTQYQIAATPEAFQILYGGIYKLKELAVVRETIANAYDAHVKAKTTDTPFEIHLPTVLEPFFKVKDYGTGLSEKAIHQLYTTFFKTDKTDPNDPISLELIGGKGLGSKAPLAYSDQFSVQSRYNGTLSRYQMFISADGVPACATISETPTNEPNGLTVEVPVATKDISAFASAAIQILPHLPFPYVLNAKPEDLSNEKLQTPTYFAEFQINPTTNIKIQTTNDNRYGTSNSVVLQGIIAYPIDRNAFDGYGAISSMLNMGLCITIPIGTFDITASREGLSYTSKTKTDLEKLLIQTVIPLAQHIKISIDQANNLFDARLRYDSTAYNVKLLIERFKEHASYKLLNQTEKKEFDDLYTWYSETPTWKGKELEYLKIPDGLLIKRISHARRSCRSYDYIDRMTLSNSDANARPKIWWRPKTASFKRWFEEDHTRMPAWLIIGDEAKAKELIEGMGLTWDSTAMTLPTVPKTPSGNHHRGGRTAYGAHRYKCLDNSPKTAAEALAMGHQLVVLNSSEDALRFREHLQAIKDTNALDLGETQFTFLIVPPSHNNIIKSLVADGAINSVDALVAKYPANPKIIAHLLAVDTACQAPETWDIYSASKKVDDYFETALKEAKLNAIQSHIKESKYFELLKSKDSAVIGFLPHEKLITDKQQAAGAEQLKDMYTRHQTNGTKFKARYPLVAKPNDIFDLIRSYHAKPAIDLIISYFKTTTPR